VWSTAFTFEHEGGPLVVRFGRHVEDFRKDKRAATLYGRCIPVPRVWDVGEAFEGYAYAISEWADGEAITGLPEPHFRVALPSLLDALDALRAAVPPTETGFGWWPSQGRARHDTWRDALLGIVEDEENPRLAGWRAPTSSGRRCLWPGGFGGLPALLAQEAHNGSPKGPSPLASVTSDPSRC
jgi:hygromycin-B 4-O-kinase